MSLDHKRGKFYFPQFLREARSKNDISNCSTLKHKKYVLFVRILEEYMSDSVEFVITNEDWDQNFDEVS